MTNEAYDNSTILDPRIAERLKRDDKGLVAAVIHVLDVRSIPLYPAHIQFQYDFP